MKEVDYKIRMINALNDTLSLLYQQASVGFSNEDLIKAVEDTLLKILLGTNE